MFESSQVFTRRYDYFKSYIFDNTIRKTYLYIEVYKYNFYVWKMNKQQKLSYTQKILALSIKHELFIRYAYNELILYKVRKSFQDAPS